MNKKVPKRGLEPPRIAPHGSKPCAYTNSATSASQKSYKLAKIDVLVFYIMRQLFEIDLFFVRV